MNNKRILIVEDEALVAMALEVSLQILGYGVAGTAYTSEAAYTMIEEREPDLILMDIKLAGDITGIDIAKEVYDTKKIPVIFVTGNSDEKTKERAMSINPAGYLNKPIHEDMLKEAIEKALPD